MELFYLFGFVTAGCVLIKFFKDIFTPPKFMDLCDTCRLRDGTICGYGSASDLPFYKCNECRIIDEARDVRIRKRRLRKQQEALTKAKKILGL